MAGDWLKLESSTPDKPEVQAISDELGICCAEVVGRLILVWRWFDQQSRDGYAPVTLSALSKIAGLAGFAESMEKQLWLSTGKKGVTVMNFDRHNGKSAKTRALTKDRVKRYRNAPNVTSASPEKRNKEYTPQPPADRSAPRSKPATKCSYCDAAKEGNVNGFDYCHDQDHFRQALDHVKPFTQPTHAREASAEDRPKLDPDQGYPVKAKRGKFDDEPGDDSQRLSDLPPGT